jgi:hypothetical protein
VISEEDENSGLSEDSQSMVDLGISPRKLSKYKSIQSVSDHTSSPHHSSQGMKSFDNNRLQNTTLDLQKMIS